MKKIITTFLLAIAMTVSSYAITVNDAAGAFKGLLNVGGDQYPNKEIFILPGVQSGTVTFVLPDFSYNGAPLGDIVLVNIPMSSSGQLTLENASLYIRAISERARITVVNGLEDEGVTYNSYINTTSAQVLLSIAAPSLPEPIFVLFSGARITNENYAITNGGFEGSWSNNEVNGWHSFKTATGTWASTVSGNTEQFEQSTEKRPGSAGTYSAKLRSNIVLTAKANGNCTNGQINAGSTSAADASGNYNFSDPSNTGYNTSFVGNPDSLVFWAKYIPADKNPSNTANRARTHAVITTNARYQDPETTSYASVKIADAAINYSANSSMGWQRLSVPFTYTAVNPDQAAYMLITFTTNETPGGGSTYSTGSIFNKKYYYDNLYIDDAEMIYNHDLTSLTMNGQAVAFSNGQAFSQEIYNDSSYNFVATTNGRAAKSFIGYDALTNSMHLYVVADNYSQAKAYSLYTLQMVAPPVDTYYAYEASTCDNEPYSDELFSNLTEAGVYVDTIPNTQGADSIITLTLTVYPTYAANELMTITRGDVLSWENIDLSILPEGDTVLTAAYETVHGCDSILTLNLTVARPADTYYAYEASICEGEPYSDELFANLTEAGEYVDTILNARGSDSIITLTLTVYPTYATDTTMTITQGDEIVWENQDLSILPVGDTTLTAEYQTVHGCDSTMTLYLTVEARPIVTEIPQTEAAAHVTRKVIINGQMYIIREDEMYDIFGKKIK